MPEIDPREHYSPEPNILERKAARYLQRLNPAAPERRERREAEVRKLHRAHRWATIWAALAGIVSGGIIGGAEILVRLEWFEGPEGDWLEQLPYWAAFFAFAGVVSAVELLFLYWNAMRAMTRINRASGVALEGNPYSDLLTNGLARAALEFPNPRVVIYGVDPYALLADWRIAARNIAYKLKVGASSFIVRLFLRRVLGRMAVRGLIPLIAGPLYAVWNAIITWRIMREARIRALGPFAVEALSRQLGQEGEELGPRAREMILQGVGELIMLARDAHPNYVVLLSRLVEEFDRGDKPIEVDWPRQRQELKTLDGHEQRVFLDAMALAALLGSSVNRRQKELLADIHSECGMRLKREALNELRAKIMDGRRITAEDLDLVRERAAQ